MMGKQDSTTEAGIIPRLCKDLFRQIGKCLLKKLFINRLLHFLTQPQQNKILFIFQYAPQFQTSGIAPAFAQQCVCTWDALTYIPYWNPIFIRQWSILFCIRNESF